MKSHGGFGNDFYLPPGWLSIFTEQGVSNGLKPSINQRDLCDLSGREGGLPPLFVDYLSLLELFRSLSYLSRNEERGQAHLPDLRGNDGFFIGCPLCSLRLHGYNHRFI